MFSHLPIKSMLFTEKKSKDQNWVLLQYLMTVGSCSIEAAQLPQHWFTSIRSRSGTHSVASLNTSSGMSTTGVRAASGEPWRNSVLNRFGR